MWWAGTVVILVILDDLVFGPVFWLASRVAGPAVAVLAIYAIYVPTQVFLVRRGTEESPGRLADFFLKRLDLHRRNERVAEVEGQLRSKVTSTLSAIAMTLVLGGVIPPLILWRHGSPTSFVRRLSVVTAVVYATEFAVLHGVLPSLV